MSQKPKGRNNLPKVKTHFRRCHICGEMNEATGDLVSKCSHCGKHLTPFYYIDERRILGLPVKPTLRDEEEGMSQLPFRHYPPLWGLTVYWEDFHEG